jgi:hypothetical protein
MVGLGELVELSGGAKLLCKQIDLGGEAVWIEIERNEHEKSEKVINRTHSSFAYRVGDTEYVYDLEAVFLGEEKSAIELTLAGSSPVCVHSVCCDCGVGTAGGRVCEAAATQLKSEDNCESVRSLSKS